MRITIHKVSNFRSEYTILREDNSVEQITHETKTYLVHDLCHFVVERALKLSNGFWGMLSQGYSFNDLFGKENPETTGLRAVEQLVGPIQSVYLNYISRQDFENNSEHLAYKIPSHLLTKCLTEIKKLMEEWEQLAIGQSLDMEWNKQDTIEQVENDSGG
ncbi:hypothetical protein [Algoriphagus resistens]|uniref:hypothetical protein n=1 Tax=Algoriphagus resistens TaxID=1750590 RepID=UPI000716A948|nr:hypothetical protein [Algoriphagus resistens]